MPHPRVKVEPSEFRKFLHESKDVTTLWKVDDNEQFTNAFIGGTVTVDELMNALDLHIYISDFIFVCHPEMDDLLGDGDESDGDEEEDDGNAYGKIPTVKASDLDEYVVRSSMGADWLYFAYNLETAWLSTCLTLMPAGHENDEDEE